jgi:hypothetical protein
MGRVVKGSESRILIDTKPEFAQVTIKFSNLQRPVVVTSICGRTRGMMKTVRLAVVIFLNIPIFHHSISPYMRQELEFQKNNLFLISCINAEPVNTYDKCLKEK